MPSWILKFKSTVCAFNMQKVPLLNIRNFDVKIEELYRPGPHLLRPRSQTESWQRSGPAWRLRYGRHRL